MDARLTTLAEMAGNGREIADIGCDHGYLICSLLENHQADYGYACDLNELPLKKAKEQIEQRGLTDRIRLIQTDGLKDVPTENLDRVIIAGMGGELILKIMEVSSLVHDRSVTWLLQPMTKPTTLRKWLFQNGFQILEERCCLAKGKPYSAMKVRYSGDRQEESNRNIYFGSIDFRGDPYANDYRNKVLNKIEKQIREMERSRNDEAKIRIQKLNELKKELQECT